MCTDYDMKQNLYVDHCVCSMTKVDIFRLQSDLRAHNGFILQKYSIRFTSTLFRFTNKMQPGKSDSLNFRRGNSANSSTSSSRSTGMQHCRRKLQNTFEESDKESKSSNNADRTVLSVLSFNDNTRRVLRNGAERITKTFNNVRTSFGALTQRFKISTKRRQILEEGPMTPNCATPHTYSKQILGRTPTKMYSPFGIESPYRGTTYDKENAPPKEVVTKFVS